VTWLKDAERDIRELKTEGQLIENEHYHKSGPGAERVLQARSKDKPCSNKVRCKKVGAITFQSETGWVGELV
jgi:hypothetical protein